MMQGLLYGIRRFPVDLKNSDLFLLFLSIVLAVSAITGVTFLGDRLRLSIKQQAAVVLAADVTLRSTAPIGPKYLSIAKGQELNTAETISFLSMTLHGGNNVLSSIKTTTPEYPLRGKLKLLDFNGQNIDKPTGSPLRGNIWAEQSLIDRFNIAKGDSITIGNKRFVVSAVLADFPDRNVGFLAFAPTVIANIEDLDAMGVIQPGSRALYRQLYSGRESQIESFLDELQDLPAEVRIQRIENIGQQLGRTLDRSNRFFSLAGLVTIIIAAIAAMISARRFAIRHIFNCSLMKIFGATQGFVLSALIGQLLLMTLLATIVGVGVGLIIQYILVDLLKGIIDSDLPGPSLQPIWIALLTSSCLIVGTVAPYLQQLRVSQPIRVLRNDLKLDYKSSFLINAVAIFALVIFLSILFADFSLVSTIIIGLFLVGLSLFCLGALMVKCCSFFDNQIGIGWKLGLKNISKRRGESILHLVVFGLSLMALMVLTETRSDLINSWKQSLSEETPNHFFFNIQSSELDGIADFLSPRIGQAIKFTPLIRGRLLAISNGSNQETNSGRMIEREANITWYDQLPDNNSIAAGEWWGKEGESIQAVSVDEGVAESLNIGVGDQLIFNAAGVDLAVTVTSLRRIKWESFQPNFIFVLSPMVARELPQSFITSVNIPEENTQLVDEFLSRYPTVTSINLNSALNQIKNILNKASLAVQYMFLLALLAGVLTLIATIFASADQRRYESALLHTIGAKRSKIFQSIATEFFAIGIGAGLTAAIGAVFISGFLSTQIFELNYSPNILVLTGGLIFGAICIGCVGILAVREAVYAPPLLTLRDP